MARKASKKPRSGVREYVWGLTRAYNRMHHVREIRATLLLMGTLVLTGWLFYSLEPVFTTISHMTGWLSVKIFNATWPEQVAWPTWVEWLDFIIPLFAFLGLLTYIRNKYLFDPPEDVVTYSPSPRKGLIVMLSKFYAVSPDKLNIRTPVGTAPLSLEAIQKELEIVKVPTTTTCLERMLSSTMPSAWKDLRLQIFATSWGTFAAAVAHHRSRLEYCWIISTKDQTSDLAPLAAQLIKAIAGKDVTCYYDDLVVPNGTDIAPVVDRVNEIYTMRLPELTLPVREVIADFTGGTAAMTAGMILATLAPDRAIEYLQQDAPILSTDGTVLYAISPDEISTEVVLAEIETHPRLVPRTEQLSEIEA